jgi:hypothetical protein
VGDYFVESCLAGKVAFIAGGSSGINLGITLDRPGPHNKPHVREDPAVKLTSYPGTVRQLVITGLGREQPTVIITNDDQIKTRALVAQYARRLVVAAPERRLRRFRRFVARYRSDSKCWRSIGSEPGVSYDPWPERTRLWVDSELS